MACSTVCLDLAVAGEIGDIFSRHACSALSHGSLRFGKALELQSHANTLLISSSY